MKLNTNKMAGRRLRWWVAMTLAVAGLLAPKTADAGNLTAMSTPLPNGFTPGHMLLLPDGRVMVQGSFGNNWEFLLPDSQGHYGDGKWANCPSMVYSREYYSSDVLQNGKVFVAGGEDGTGGATAELFDPQANNGAGGWTTINPPTSLLNPNVPSPALASGNQAFIDSESVLLANGNVLVAPVGPSVYGGTLIYNPAANSWSAGGTCASAYQDEASWVKLPDDSILTIDPYGKDCQRYIPATDTWIQDKPVPITLYSTNGEIGAAMLQTNGTVLYVGGNNQTEIYTPSPLGGTNNGSWSPGPNLPDGLVMRDAPAAILNNGKMLLTLVGPDGDNPLYIYEYDQDTKSFNQIFSDTFDISDQTSMLDLPDGDVLFNDTGTIYVYEPDPAALTIGQPTIQSLTFNTDETLTLTGTLFNGISQGAMYGDDAQQDSNFPLVRFTSGSTVTYGRSFNWNSTSVRTGSRVITTQCAIPAAVYNNPGNYAVQVVANGNASGTVGFYSPVWVDFNYTGSTQNGGYTTPYKTLAAGVANVYVNGTIEIKASTQPSVSEETETISKAMYINSVGGPSTIGN